MVKYEQGNLLESNVDIICHGVNCVGGFGSGVAGQIAKTFPQAKVAYMERHWRKAWQLGDIQSVQMFDRLPYKNPLYIINCATQQEYYPRNKVHADYDAIRTCMTKVKEFAKMSRMSVGIPRIGCGLAGGDWNVVEKILKEVFQDYDISVYIK